MLSYGYWQRRFGGDRTILNQTLSLNGLPMTILGVIYRERNELELKEMAVSEGFKQRFLSKRLFVIAGNRGAGVPAAAPIRCGACGADGHGRPRSPDYLREHRQFADGARRRSGRRTWPCVWRSAPVETPSSGND
jgi:hypothetical protein